MGRSFETTVRVRSYELDAYRHVNHAVYLNYFEVARFRALARGGFDLDTMERRQWSVHVVRVEVDFRREARLDDVLRIRTEVEAFRQSSMVIVQEAVREDGEDEEMVAEARVVAVWVGAGGRPVRIPGEVREALGAPGADDPAT